MSFRKIKIVVDKFRIARHVVWAFNNTRIELQKKSYIQLGKHWRLLTKRYYQLDASGKRQVKEIMVECPEIKPAYLAKEYYYQMIDNHDLSQYYIERERFTYYLNKHQLKHYYFILKTLDNWHEEIEHMLTLRRTNGAIERINRTIKQAKNIAFGFTNLDRTVKLMKYRTTSKRKFAY